MNTELQTITVSPETSLEILSPLELDQLVQNTDRELYELFKRCALAVLNTGNTNDDTGEILAQHANFDIKFLIQNRGLRLTLNNPPSEAFVDGRMIRGIREQLFSVLRDVLYVTNVINHSGRFDLQSSPGITNAVFHILRNANLLRTGEDNPLIVCWGGHSISREEYDYTKEIGYELGLREVNIITGCGPGAMKGPMKGATIAHAKQRTQNRRYIGISEPGIIAAESPNPIVNELIILPDIEKRLEAFVRAAHGIIVFPGGVGTAEEILYILAILLHPENQNIPLPLIFSAAPEGEAYFKMIDNFIEKTLGAEARAKYEVFIGNPADTARRIQKGVEGVLEYRRKHKDAFYFNWTLKIEKELQFPFIPNHENMAGLSLKKDLPPHILASNLRCAFSGIVAGNVKEQGLRAIKENGPFELSGDADIMEPLDELLRAFVEQKRMKIGGKAYEPCYKVVR